MSDLNTLITEAARSGRLGGLTLFPCSRGWQANVRTSMRDGWRGVTDADPAAAVAKALTDLIGNSSGMTDDSEDIFQ